MGLPLAAGKGAAVPEGKLRITLRSMQLGDKIVVVDEETTIKQLTE